MLTVYPSLVTTLPWPPVRAVTRPWWPTRLMFCHASSNRWVAINSLILLFTNEEMPPISGPTRSVIRAGAPALTSFSASSLVRPSRSVRATISSVSRAATAVRTVGSEPNGATVCTYVSVSRISLRRYTATTASEPSTAASASTATAPIHRPPRAQPVGRGRTGRDHETDSRRSRSNSVRSSGVSSFGPCSPIRPPPIPDPS
jgi:hypothetical protein